MHQNASLKISADFKLEKSIDINYTSEIFPFHPFTQYDAIKIKILTKSPSLLLFQIKWKGKKYSSSLGNIKELFLTPDESI